jgi:hypothetical protein
MAALMSPPEPIETIHEQVVRLVGLHSEAWPPLHSATVRATLSEVVARVVGLEEALRAIALEVERLSALHDALADTE